MKIQAFLKFAVVAMAAYGAYAFSGNNANEQLTFKRSDTCQNITAECSEKSDGEACMILVDKKPIPVLGLDCYTEIKHDSNQPVYWH